MSVSVEEDDVYSDHRELNADWPRATGVSWTTLRKLNALDLDPIQGGVAPRTTLIVVDRTGKIFWTDDAARLQHAPIDELLGQVEAQIRAALAQPQTEVSDQ